MKIKYRFKQYFDAYGLTPVIRAIVYFPREVGVILNSLRFYLFNCLITFFPLHWIRKIYLKSIMHIPIGKNSFIHMGCIFYANVRVGENSVIGRGCHILGDTTVGNNVSITAQTYIFATSHRKDSATFEAFCEPVTIEDYAWIGARAIILPGVRIGKGAILGAGSVATKNIPDHSICVGSPAKCIGKRSDILTYRLNYSPYFQ